MLHAAGIEFVAAGVDDVRGPLAAAGRPQPIAGRERAGSSTWQSLARGTPARSRPTT